MPNFLLSEHQPDPGLESRIRELTCDIEVLGRRYPLTYSAARLDRFERLYRDWQDRLAAIPFSELTPAGKVDQALTRNFLAASLRSVELARGRKEWIDAAIPFSAPLIELEERRIAMQSVDGMKAARAFAEMAAAIQKTDKPEGLDGGPVADWLRELRDALERWKTFYFAYDPNLTWWVRQPLAELEAALDEFAKPSVTGGPIPGRPVGREALLADLQFEVLPYTPEELIAIGDREYAWCLEEMKKAAAELGFGEDWRAAIESVKDTYVAPGEQPRVVRELALEAIAYLEARDLLTIPDLAKETWRMEMMAAERQKVNPFFLGGEEIIVSYPTETMTHAEKLMSMRGNNPNFSRATVQHELIPGHHLQMFMTARHRSYRQLFSTPFWIEGWTLYWELLLWRLGFPRTAEERIGMLFWRMHRCVRISFSLRFHLGELTSQECVDILVDRVGHERANAEGEVRRSFNGAYPPLYQAAYMIGGLQFQAIEQELVGGGSMTFRQFHDAILRENEMPPAMMRLVLRGETPPEDDPIVWRFDESPVR